jgi:hypothetical protein
LIPPTAEGVPIPLDDSVLDGFVEDASERPDIYADGGFRNVLPKHPSFEVVQVIDGDLRKENIASEFFEGIIASLVTYRRPDPVSPKQLIDIRTEMKPG